MRWVGLLLLAAGGLVEARAQPVAVPGDRSAANGGQRQPDGLGGDALDVAAPSGTS